MGKNARYLVVLSLGSTSCGPHLALDEFHHQRPDAVGFFEPVDLRDIGMIQRSKHLCFAGESRQAVGVVRERVGEDLDRDVAIQLRIAGSVNLSHPPFADRRGDLVDAETGARSERQVAGL